jgi:linoleate 10R-lipoxygenase
MRLSISNGLRVGTAKNHSRFHNYVVEQLAMINENGRFTKPRQGLPADVSEDAWAKYDNDLFQTGRL